MNKDFTERIIELVRDDKELHDATVKLFEAYASLMNEQAADRKAKRERMYPK